MSFLEACRRLVGIDSSPRHGTLAAAEYLGSLCEQAGLHVDYQRESLAGLEQCNLIVRPQAGLPAEEILFQTHLDTSDPGHFSRWTKTQSNPFNASIYNDEIFGLGTADAKLDFLCKLEAAKALQGKALKIPFVLVGTYGAQNGMAGAIKLVRRKKLSAKRAFIGEPTNMQLIVAGQGVAVVEVSIPFSEEEKLYRSEHDVTESSSTQSKMFSAKAEEGNAIVTMLAYLSQLPEGIAIMDLDGGTSQNSVPNTAVLEIDLVGGFRDPILPKISRIFRAVKELEQRLKEFAPNVESSTRSYLNLGMIRTTADEVLLTGTCRLPPSASDGQYEAWMKELAAAARETGAAFRLLSYVKGFSSGEMSDFVHTTQSVLADLGHTVKINKNGGVTEASVLNRSGVECLVWGPGQSFGNSLAPNESIKIEDLKRAIVFYTRIMERLCL